MSGSHYNNQFAWCFPAPTCSFWGGYCGSDCTNNTALYEYDDCDEGQLCCLDGTYFLYTRHLLASANICIVLSKFGVEYFWFCTVILIAKIAGSTLSRLHSDTFALALSADLYFFGRVRHSGRCLWSFRRSLYPSWAPHTSHTASMPIPTDNGHCDNDDVFKWKHFCATGHLCWEFNGHRWIPLTMASDAELWCCLWSAPEEKVK